MRVNGHTKPTGEMKVREAPPTESSLRGQIPGPRTGEDRARTTTAAAQANAVVSALRESRAEGWAGRPRLASPLRRRAHARDLPSTASPGPPARTAASTADPSRSVPVVSPSGCGGAYVVGKYLEQTC